MIATTTRPVTFSITDRRTKVLIVTRVFPAGTEVYATDAKRGALSIRIPGTLFTQTVSRSTVEPIA